MKRPKRATREWHGGQKRMTIATIGNNNIANMKVAEKFTNDQCKLVKDKILI
jgi:hypothetical protein